MRIGALTIAVVALSVLLSVAPLRSEENCQGYGPQTPRDVGLKAGSNLAVFALAPDSTALNLCNLHFHSQAEHKGPGFSLFAGEGEHGGYRCDVTPGLSAEELKDPFDGKSSCRGVKPGDTIEVHWVYTSCDLGPGPSAGEGLDACTSDKCVNPQLRVEAQIFLLVNDPTARSFEDYRYSGAQIAGYYQPKALPAGTGEPVLFAGSTTGPEFDNTQCSPLQVTWRVRPQCAKLDFASLNKWCEGNPFLEDYAHGVRPLVTAPELLAPID